MNIAQKATIRLVRFYQKRISPLFPSKCRYSPTCSSYTIESIQKFGAMRGTLKGIRRILRCNHFSKGGFDPVPENLSGEYKWLL